MSTIADSADKPKTDQDQKKMALGHVKGAWLDAWMDGVDAECMAQVSLFVTLTELVAATARMRPPSSPQACRSAFPPASSRCAAPGSKGFPLNAFGS